MDQNKFWDLGNLLHKLQSEHCSSYVYRGQTEEFVPLVPSLYRGFIDKTQRFERGKIISLYGTGKIFYQTYSGLGFSDYFKRQFSFAKMLLGLFGLPIGTFFCQHCCVPSEGLDVTEGPLIAGFFAIFDYRNNHYFSDYNKYGVIYRITVPQTKLRNLGEIKQIDDYSCPFYLNGNNILGLIGECQTIDQAINSYKEFQFQDCYLKTQTDIDLSKYRLHRPLEILRLPKAALKQGRIFKQKAGLVFPDLIFDQKYDLRLNRQEGIPWRGNLCIEDLSKSIHVESFRFRHSNNNMRLIDLNPGDIFPEDDPIRSMLTKVLTGLFGVPLLNWDRNLGVALTPGDEKHLLR